MEFIRARKTCLALMIVLVLLGSWLYLDKINLEYALLQERAIPDIELINYLQFDHRGVASGALSGFVLFDNRADQPRDIRQYYVIGALDTFDSKLNQLFSLEEVLQLNAISPRRLAIETLHTKDNTTSKLVLEDNNGNLFMIDKLSREVTTRDVQGDPTHLITDEWEYRDFMRDFLRS